MRGVGISRIAVRHYRCAKSAFGRSDCSGGSAIYSILKAPPKTEVFVIIDSNNSINSGCYEKIEIHRNSNLDPFYQNAKIDRGDNNLLTHHENQ
jgi:hypothetical protein